MVTKKPNTKSRHQRQRVPFWLPVGSYYVLAASVALIFFFLVWGTLSEGGEETPWITAGISASALMIVAVAVREIVLRNARQRYLLTQKRLDRNLRSIRGTEKNRRNKITLSDNEKMLSYISRKSEAASVLSSVADGHSEVVGFCDDYLDLTKTELSVTNIRSPRYAAMRKGRRRVEKLHKLHLLSLTEIRSKELTRQARAAASYNDRISIAREAVTVVEDAIRRYPDESTLLDSAEALREYASAISVAEMVDQAEVAAEDGDLERAIQIYRDIYDGLPDEHFNDEERALLAEKINLKLEELDPRVTG